ncbi:Dom34 protein [Scenedesmus sp. NREL 46B-D3]|nr:Dom34 protein [Scenedesmus sp. NREL 46B-D3]
MKLLYQSYVKNGSGEVKIVAEEAEDMWHVFNLVREGDRVTGTTFRKVAKESGTGAESERVKIRLAIQVEGVEFDPEGSSIRLKGRNLTECEHIKLGAYHTLELEPQRAFSLAKACWDSLDIERLRSACDPQASADLAALLITEGLANLCLVGSSTTLVRAKVEANLPRKRGAAVAGYDKAWDKFMDQVFSAVLRHVDWSVVKHLKAYLEAEAVRRDARPLIENKASIITAQASSAYKHSLKEVLALPAIAGKIKDTKAAREVAALQEFYAMLGADSSRAFYGPGHVLAAAELGAIQTLLISDKLFRINNVAKRKKYADLVEGVREAGGEALLFSSMHVSGEQLNNLSGIAAVLRFPLPELEDQEIVEDI